MYRVLKYPALACSTTSGKEKEDLVLIVEFATQNDIYPTSAEITAILQAMEPNCSHFLLQIFGRSFMTMKKGDPVGGRNLGAAVVQVLLPYVSPLSFIFSCE